MNDSKPTSIFISFSGDRSKQVAQELYRWLPSVIPTLSERQIYVSFEIEKGAVWNTEVRQQLARSTYGILCVTSENVRSPWLLFEGGALSKNVRKGVPRVTPFLLDLSKKEFSELHSPLGMFQVVTFTKEDVKRMLVSLNKTLGDKRMDQSKLDGSFGKWYPDFAKRIDAIRSTPHPADGMPEDNEKRSETSHVDSFIKQISREMNKISAQSSENQKYLRLQIAKLDGLSSRIDGFRDGNEDGTSISERQLDYIAALGRIPGGTADFYMTGAKLISAMRSGEDRQSVLDYMDHIAKNLDRLVRLTRNASRNYDSESVKETLDSLLVAQAALESLRKEY